MKLKYFSTFTGVGGLDYGLEKLGAECVGYSEIKESSIKIYKHHYPNHKNYGDITKIEPKELPDFDVFIGGFPCQSFSMAGIRKGFTDKRGKMIFYIHDIIKEKKPKYVVLENVKGILNHDNGKTFRNVIAMLQLAGYYVRVLHLNSALLGSAQARERIIFICRYGKDFEKVNPIKIDDTKRFRDIREEGGGIQVSNSNNTSENRKRSKWIYIHRGIRQSKYINHRAKLKWQKDCAVRT